jgi:hypothetical protein
MAAAALFLNYLTFKYGGLRAIFLTFQYDLF